MTPAERPSRFPWPPVIYAAAAALGATAEVLRPLPWLGSPASDILFAIGWLAAIGGLALVLATAARLRRAQTAIGAHMPATRLVTDGPFALSRNPIYVGFSAMLIGAALILGNLWLLGAALLAGFATAKLAIEGEERHLEARFGRPYREYKKTVRRWL